MHGSIVVSIGGEIACRPLDGLTRLKDQQAVPEQKRNKRCIERTLALHLSRGLEFDP